MSVEVERYDPVSTGRGADFPSAAGNLRDMPVAETSATLHTATVIDRRTPAQDIVVSGLFAPSLAAHARAGQFVMVVPPAGSAVSTALGIYEATGDRVSLMIVVVGPRTAELAALQPGSEVSLLGPLGNGFDLGALGNDVAHRRRRGRPRVAAARRRERIAAAGARGHLYYGARTREALVDVDLFERLGIEAIARHRRRIVRAPRLRHRTARRAQRIPASPRAARRRCCARSQRVAARTGIPAQLSLEETFACGVGGVLGLRGAAGSPQRAGAGVSACGRRRAPRLRARAHLRGGPGLLGARAAVVSGAQAALAGTRTSPSPSARCELASPTLMGSGCYGSGAEYAPFVDLASIGGVVLKSVTPSAAPRQPIRRGSCRRPRACSMRSACRIPASTAYLANDVAKFADRPCAVVGSVAGFSVDDYALRNASGWPRATRSTRSN